MKNEKPIFICFLNLDLENHVFLLDWEIYNTSDIIRLFLLQMKTN